MKPDDAVTLACQGFEQLAAALRERRSDALESYLAAMAKFHKYSFPNSLMIHLQFPSATRVAGYRKWQELGRQVRDGETGIAVFTPVFRGQMGDQKRLDVVGRVGHAVRGFRVVHVFDVSQTEGKPLPELAQVSGDPGLWLRRLEEVACDRGIQVQYVEYLLGAKAISTGRTVCILERLKPTDRFLTLVHELAHEPLHESRRRYATTRTVGATEAEAVGFVVSRAIGLDCLGHSADYIQLYRGNTDTLCESLYYIRKTAADLIEALHSVPTASKDTSLSSSAQASVHKTI